jgi:invasion protein IalB
MRLPITRLGAAALATSLALGSGAALAQTAPAKPAAPAAPGALGAQPVAPQPPSKVDLVSPEPQWVKLCGQEKTTNREACQTMRDFGSSADQPPMISMQVFELQGEEKRKLRFMVLPIGMLLRPGFRVVVDKAEPIDGKYDMCFQNACTAEVDIGAGTLNSLKKGQNLAVIMRLPSGGEPSGRELTLNIPLKDFGATFDGKPTDPKLLEQQRQALQQQLQKKAEEQRKMLEQQQSGTAAPAAPAAAAPAAPAPKQ